jgi:alpha(1,3/1,4) fucosyltransferase
VTVYKIGFVGFHPSFSPRSYGLVRVLEERFDLDIVSLGEEPDFLFFSVYGYSHLDPIYDRCTKIFTCEENIRIPWADCDYAVTGDHVAGMDLRHLRFPIYAKSMEEHETDLTKSFDAEQVLGSKTRFCTFVVSCPHARHREIFFEELSRYRRVDSGGRWLNNVGGSVVSKLDFIRESKFNVAFENSRHPGYVTEKLVEAMVAECVPIYWGDRGFHREFNPRAVVNANEREGSLCLGEDRLRRFFSMVVDEIARLDQDDDAYLAKLREPWLHMNAPLPWSEAVGPFFKRVFDAGPGGYWRRVAPQSFATWQDLEGRDWMKPGYWGVAT